MQRGVKRLYRKYESRWEYDEPDIHGNHRRRIYKFGKRRLRRVLDKETNKEIKNETE